MFVEHDDRRGVGHDHLFMRPVDPVRSSQVEEVAADQHRTTRRVVRADAEFHQGIVSPDDVAILRSQFHRFPALAGHEPAFVQVRAVIPIGLPGDVETEHVARSPDQVDPIAFDGRRGANAQVLVREKSIAGQPRGSHRSRELPEELARLLVEALDQPALGTAEPGVFRKGQVVGPDIHMATGDGGIPIGIRTQAGDPLDSPGRRHVDTAAFRVLLTRLEAFRQAALTANHVAVVVTAPARPILRRHDLAPDGNQHRGQGRTALLRHGHQARSLHRAGNSTGRIVLPNLTCCLPPFNDYLVGRAEHGVHVANGPRLAILR